MLNTLPLFDSHFHIIDDQYPLIPNQGYLPDSFTVQSYLKRTSDYQICGGAVVSGSFQGFDQNYLINTLKQLGPQFFGVTQLPASTTDPQIIKLHQSGIRALRFNLKRGGSEDIAHLSRMAHRVYELVGWHVELYIDSSDLAILYTQLTNLPAVSIDHLGLTKTGFNTLIKLAEKGIKVKASGFSRINFDVKTALTTLYTANPSALMFGTDLPSTRAPIPYQDNDFITVIDTLGEEAANAIFSQNALDFYQPK
ncbi:amidohydrolase family protein [Shewanella surugensis]|uniref:Amidohydrolase family protein n=1 Tax=Shewanella surugensis TaxID=212020 RepID=A0ABT0LHN6_9GAMM|nr:amidohydrolase family protein [Shewanella surugensis]MCL1126975.1 amidohydrolase family protein [Shewanella surugensis]